MNITQANSIRDNTMKNNAQDLQRGIERAKQKDNFNLEHRKKQLEEVGMSFEKILLNQMLSAMRDSLDKKNDLLYGGMSQEIFEDMLYDKYAENMAQSKVLGFAQTIVSQYEKYL